MSHPLLHEHRLATLEIEGLPDPIALERLQGSEAISQLFRFELDLVSESQGIPFGSVVGRRATITIGLEQIEKFEEEERRIPGIISHFSHVRVPKTAWDAYRVFRYHAVVVPDLWLLSQTTTSRIFEQKTVAEIVDTVCDEHQVKLEWRHTRQLSAREYCVQYGETDLDFVSRLLEDEGLFYYFQTDPEGLPVCVISDSEAGAEIHTSHGRIERLAMREEMRTNRVTVGDYDYGDPDSSEWGGEIYRASDQARTHGSGMRELFEYPAGHEKLGTDAGEIARRRMEEQEAQITIVSGEGTGWNLAAGHVFDVGEWDHEHLNQQPFRMTSVRHRLRHARRDDVDMDAVGSPQEGTDDHYENWFECIPSALPFRPPRVTRKPRMRGPQTATVIGRDAPTGETGSHNSTDAYGRVRVRFPWARAGEASCWIRVSQAWAGKQWGAMQIPHAGQEVIVDFLDGDPDRPIITGRVYNAKNKIPELDEDRHPHKTLMRDDYGNEIVLNATPGDEHIRIYSPHHDSRLVVGRSVQGWTSSDDSKTVLGNAASATLGNSAKATLGSSFSATAGLNLSATGGAMQSILLGMKGWLHVGPAFSYHLGASKDQVDEDKESGADGKNLMKAGTDLNLIAGLPEDGDHSILHATKDALTLTVGGKQPPVEEPSSAAAKRNAILILTGLAGALATIAASGTWVNDNGDDKRGAWHGTFAGMVLLLTVVASIVSQEKAEDIEVVTHEDDANDAPHAKVKLHQSGDEGKVDVIADEIRLRAQADVNGDATGPQVKITESDLTLSAAEEQFRTGVKVETGGDVTSEAERNVYVNATKQVLVTGQKVLIG